MPKNQAKRVTIHLEKPEDASWLQEQAGAFYVEWVKQSLEESGLTAKQKADVVEKIAALLQEQQTSNRKQAL